MRTSSLVTVVSFVKPAVAARESGERGATVCTVCRCAVVRKELAVAAAELGKVGV